LFLSWLGFVEVFFGTDFADYTDFLMEDTSGLMIKVEYKMVVFVQPAKWDFEYLVLGSDQDKLY
jgi:hypothetical protein